MNRAQRRAVARGEVWPAILEVAMTFDRAHPGLGDHLEEHGDPRGCERCAFASREIGRMLDERIPWLPPERHDV